jgi:hypothetical protein
VVGGYSETDATGLTPDRSVRTWAEDGDATSGVGVRCSPGSHRLTGTSKSSLPRGFSTVHCDTD